MSRELLAVEGCTLDHSDGSLLSGGTFEITSIPSIKVKGEGQGVYKTPLVVSFSGGTYSGGVSGTAVGAGTIIATSTKNKVEGLFPLRVGDSGTIAGTYTQSGTPPIPLVPFTAQFEITDAGQAKVLGE